MKLGSTLKSVVLDRRFDYLLLSLFGLLVFIVWFRGTGLYFGGDMIYPLRPILDIRSILFTWTDSNGGTSNALSIALYFLYSFFYGGTSVGLPLFLIQRIFLYFNFVLPGLGMYFLSSVVYPKVSCNRIGIRTASLVAALCFMVSPSLLHQPQVWWFYGVFPFILGFFIKTIDAPDVGGKIKYSLLAALFSFGLTAFLPEYQPEADLLLIFAMYSAGYWAINKGRAKKLLESCFIFAVVVALINLGILLPWLITLFNQGTRVISSVPLTFSGQWLELRVQGLIRNMGLIADLGPDGGRFLPSGFYYLPGQWLYIVNFSLVVLAFSALLLRRSMTVVYFGLVAVVGVVISNGPNPPFGDVYEWLLENFLILRGFRTVSESNVLIALGYSILIGVAVSALSLKVLGRHAQAKGRASSRGGAQVARYGMIGGIVALIFVNGWPMVTGAYYNTPAEWPNNLTHDIPPSYLQVDQWLNNQDSSQNYRVLALPLQQSYQSAYWPSGYYFGVQVMPFLTSKPLIFDVGGRLGLIPQVVNLTYGISSSDPTLTAKMAGLLNVKYFYIDNYAPAQNLYKVYDQPNEVGYKYQASFGELQVFSIDQNLVFPRVYATSEVQLLNGTVSDTLPQFLSTANFSSTKPALFMSGDLSDLDWSFVRNLSLSREPAVVFNQVDPTAYTVRVNASRPFILVLSTQFDPYWVASINGVDVGMHIIANGYANAWYVDKVGSFSITLAYEIQDYFYYGLAISGVSFVACLAVAENGPLKKLTKPKERIQHL